MKKKLKCSDGQELYYYQQTPLNSLNIKITMSYVVGYLDPGLGQAKKCVGAKPVNGIWDSTPPPPPTPNSIEIDKQV